MKEKKKSVNHQLGRCTEEPEISCPEPISMSSRHGCPPMMPTSVERKKSPDQADQSPASSGRSGID